MREEASAASAACRAMIEPAAKLGFGAYRSHLDFMDLVAEPYSFKRHARRRFAETIKACRDPNGLPSPGKQGIWPRAYRNERPST